MNLPPLLTRVAGPSASSSQSSSKSSDYSGLDDLIKRQDAISAGRDDKFASLYSGDIAGSVTSGNRVRDLVRAVRAHAPNADERNPMQVSQPLSRITSESSSSSSNNDGGSIEGQHASYDMTPGGSPMGGQQRNAPLARNVLPARGKDRTRQRNIALSDMGGESLRNFEGMA